MGMDLERRFGGVRRLYGEAGLARLQALHICVIGIGGVGSWAAEALARNAVGHITLIDLDNIAESNVNRQLHAIEGEFGKAKVRAMAQRIHAINQACRVNEIEDFVTVDNAASMLGSDSEGGFDGVIDAIDDARVKAAIAAYCHKNKLALVMTGGAGGRLDPTKIKHADLARVTGDRLLAKVRTTLRRDYGFPGGEKASMGIPCIYSDEPVTKPDQSCATDTALTANSETDALAGLNCAGYGSSVCVTAPFGMAATALIIKRLLA